VVNTNILMCVIFMCWKIAKKLNVILVLYFSDLTLFNMKNYRNPMPCTTLTMLLKWQKTSLALQGCLTQKVGTTILPVFNNGNQCLFFPYNIKKILNT